MIGNIVGGPLDQTTVNQLKVRQEIAASGYGDSPIKRSPKVKNFLNNRTAWVKFASGVDIAGKYASEKIKNIFEGSGINIDTDDPATLGLLNENLAKRFILFNGTSTLNVTNNWDFRFGVASSNNYQDTFNTDILYGGIGQDRGLQPFPGITDLKVKTLNRGSIRKATISLKCYNKLQFNIIEALYLRLGFNMLIEFGYDKYIDGITKGGTDTEPSDPIIKEVKRTFIENGFFERGTKSEDVYNGIDNFRAVYNGNYDGFYGKVQNFSWKINDDLSYDITVDLVTIGSLITSLKSNIPSTVNSSQISVIATTLGDIVDLNEYDKDKDEDIRSKDAAEYKIPDIGTDAITIYLMKKTIQFPQLKSSKDYLYVTEIVEKSTGGSSRDGVVSLANPRGKTENINGRLYETISGGLQRAAFNLEKSKDNRYFIRFGTFLTEYFDIVNYYITKSNQKSKKDQPLLEFLASDNIYCNYQLDLIPLDLRVCYFKPVFSSITKANCFTTGVSSADKLTENENTVDFVVDKKGVITGKLMNMYINISFLAQQLQNNLDKEGNLSIFTYISNILNGINRSTAGVTNLELIVDNDREVKILEKNTPKGMSLLTKEQEQFEFEAYGFGNNTNQASIIQNFNIKSKIPPDLMTLISIGAASPQSETNGIKALSFNSFNRGLENRFEREYDQPTQDLGGLVTTEQIENTQENLIIDKFHKTFETDFQDKRSNSKHSNYRKAINDKLVEAQGIHGKSSEFWGYTWGSGKTEGNGGRPMYEIRWETPKGVTRKLELKGNQIPGGYIIYEGGYNKYLLPWGKNLDNSNYYIGANAGEYEGYIKAKVLQITRDYEKGYDKSAEAVRTNTSPATYQEYLTEAFGGDFDYNIDIADENSETAQVQQRTVDINNAKWFEINPSFINQGKSLFKLMKAEYDKVDYLNNGVVSNSTGFIPLETSFDLDGLSTFKIFQKIKISQKFLPNNYPQTLNFIIKNIDHALKDNQWTTSITTVSIPVQDQLSSLSPSKLDQQKWPESDDKPADRSGCNNTPKAGLPTVAYDDSSISLLNPCSNTGLIIKSTVQPNKKIIVIHHTASNGSAAQYVKGWIRKFYPIATHFIIERRSGKAVRLFEDKYWSNHIGETPGEYTNGDPDEQEPYMLSIEIDNYGYLTKKGSTYVQGDKRWKASEISVTRPVKYKTNTTNAQKLLKQAEENLIRSWNESLLSDPGFKKLKSIKDFSFAKSPNGEPYVYGLSLPKDGLLQYDTKGNKFRVALNVAHVLAGGPSKSFFNPTGTSPSLGLKAKNSGYIFTTTEAGTVRGKTFVNSSYVSKFFNIKNNINNIITHQFNGKIYKTDGISGWYLWGAVYLILKNIINGSPFSQNMKGYITESEYKKLEKKYANYQVITYKGYSYFQNYTDAQIKSTCKVVKNWAIKYKIPVAPTTRGSRLWNKWFNLFFGCDDNGKAKLDTSIFRSDAAMAKATYTHNSYKKTKVDIFPQKELLEGLWKVSVELNKKHNIVYPGDKALKKRGS